MSFKRQNGVRAKLSQSFTTETMMTSVETSSSSEEEDEYKAKVVDEEEDLEYSRRRFSSLSLVRTLFSSQPDLPTYLKVHLLVSRKTSHTFLPNCRQRR